MDIKKTEKLDKVTYERCLKQLDEVTDALTEAYRTYNRVSDPVIMDSCIFEINALRSRRNTLLRTMKQLQ